MLQPHLAGEVGRARFIPQSCGSSRFLTRLKCRKSELGDWRFILRRLREHLELARGFETKKSKFAKRTWNVPWNQHFHFSRLTSLYHRRLQRGKWRMAMFAMCASEDDRRGA